MLTSPFAKSNLSVWLLAARPRTLPAAASPVLVGSALAFYDGSFQLVPALATLLAALLLQIGANFANDVFDFKRGADTESRLGPPRVTALGLLTPAQVVHGMYVVFGLAALIGCYLVLVGGWPILAIGALSILAALAYTGGPLPFGYLGLGDLFVFIFFGLAAVGGTYFIQAGSMRPLVIWSAVPIGLLTTAVLVVNNLRDLETDRAAGKKTLAVRLGVMGTRIEYVALLAGAGLIPLVLPFAERGLWWLIFTWLSLFLAVPLVRTVWTRRGRVLNSALAGTAQLELIYALLYAVALVLARFLAP